jgi:hypothetical protein
MQVKLNLVARFKMKKKCTFHYNVPILRRLCKHYTQLDQTLPTKMASTLNAVQHQVTENEMAKDKKFGLWMSTQQGNVRLCPACFVCIEKNRGCGHMSCSRCGHDFQWDEQDVRLPKSEEEKRQETDFLQQCSLHRIGTKELIELYWPSYATNMRGMIQQWKIN